MNIEYKVTDWLRVDAPRQAPARLLERSVDRAIALPQNRPLWRRLRPQTSGSSGAAGGSTRLMLLAATLVALAVLGALAVFGSRPRTIEPSPASANGWVAFTTDRTDAYGNGDIYFVEPGVPEHIAVAWSNGTQGGNCPAFSPDGTQLAYGRLKFAGDGGPLEATIDVDLIEAGRDSARLHEFDIGQGYELPCPLWSPDGRWLAFVASPMPSDGGVSTGPGELRTIFVDSGGSTSSAVTALDIDWLPDNEVAVATGTGVTLFGADQAPHQLAGTDGAVSVSVSPDGNLVAFQRGGLTDLADLVVVDRRSGASRTVVSAYAANQGIGPIWSPDGRALAFQRLCDTVPDQGTPCREQHDVVVLSATNDDWIGSSISETVMPETRTSGSETTFMWPFRVTWAPDGVSLLYSTFDNSLVDVPLAPASSPTVLGQQDDVSPFNGSPGAVPPIQSWQRAPEIP